MLYAYTNLQFCVISVSKIFVSNKSFGHGFGTGLAVAYLKIFFRFFRGDFWVYKSCFDLEAKNILKSVV